MLILLFSPHFLGGKKNSNATTGDLILWESSPSHTKACFRLRRCTKILYLTSPSFSIFDQFNFKETETLATFTFAISNQIKVKLIRDSNFTVYMNPNESDPIMTCAGMHQAIYHLKVFDMHRVVSSPRNPRRSFAWLNKQNFWPAGGSNVRRSVHAAKKNM